MNALTLTFISVLTAITLLLVPPTVAVFGQFQVNPEFAGQSFTSDEVAQGKADHLSAKWQIIISSGSMLPLYEIGESVTLDTSIPYEALKVGDVVAFTPNEAINCDTGLGCDLIMHRVIELDSDNFTTQGDNNDRVIEELEEDISKTQYVGFIVEAESNNVV